MKTRDDLPTATDRGQLVTKLVLAGINGTRLANIITPGKTRGEIWQGLQAYARTRTKTRPAGG